MLQTLLVGGGGRFVTNSASGERGEAGLLQTLLVGGGRFVTNSASGGSQSLSHYKLC